MRKIRIGNDIRVKLTIRPNELAGFDKIDEFDLSSVKLLRCYLINTSYFRPKKDDVEPKPLLRVGFPEFYHPSHHNINNAGFPSYHMRPANLCNYDRFEPDFHSFHWWPGYRGFGLHPEHFHDHCCHLQHGPKPDPGCCNPQWWGGDPHIGREHIPNCFHNPPLPPCAEPHHPLPEPYDIYGRPVEDHRHPNPFVPTYLADSQVTLVKNTLTCFFPAVQQKLCGTYKLVVVLTVFELGWGRHNLRTYTIDKGDVFELVDDESGESGNITVGYDDSGNRVNYIKSIYAESSDYIMATDSVLKLGESDSIGTDYNIYVKLQDDTTALYNPYDWHFNKIEFTSENPELVSVDKFGTLTTYDFNDDLTQKETYIIMKNIDDEDEIEYKFKVIVKKLDVIKIGFDTEQDVYFLQSNKLNEFSTKSKYYELTNVVDGSYLWVLSQRRIHYIKAIDSPDEELISEMSSGLRVPMMTSPKPKDGYFCYRSTAPILGGKMYIKIKFE